MGNQFDSRGHPYKLFFILLLTLPLLVILSFQPYDAYKKSLFEVRMTSGEQQKQFIQNMQKQIDEKIQFLKEEVGQMHQQELCLRFKKLNKQMNSHRTIVHQNNTLFCNQPIDRYYQQIYVTIIFEKSISSNLQNRSFDTLEKQIKQTTGIQAKIILQMIETSTLPQQIKDKINNRNYMSTIANQFVNLKYLKHCRYTSKKCINYAILLNNWSSDQRGYYKVNQVIFTQISNFQATLTQVLTSGLNSFKAWSNYIRIRNLQSFKKQLQLIDELKSSNRIKTNEVYLKQSIKNIQNYIKGGTQLKPSLLFDKKVTQTDLFPSQYKLGIYLPLVLIVVLFPCFNTCKL